MQQQTIGTSQRTVKLRVPHMYKYSLCVYHIRLLRLLDNHHDDYTKE